MDNIKILLTRSMLQKDIDYICKGLDEKIANKYSFVVPCSFTEEAITAEAVDADILLGPYVTEKIISAAEKLKLIQIPWTGMDTFDFSSVKNITVPICNTHSNADAVCELGIALTLDLIKKVSFHDRKMRSGSWNRDQKPLDLTSRLMSKQVICILGYGNIGRRIGRIFSAFGSDIIAVDAFRPDDNVVKEVYSPNQINEALNKADIVISALPLTKDTRGLINSQTIGNMKDGVLIVNLSRAGIIEEDALYEGLLSGKVGGFASDVWWNTPKRGESESYPSSHNDFISMDNVVMSPHRAGFIENSLPHLDGAIDNIIRMVMGEELIGKVNVNNEY